MPTQVKATVAKSKILSTVTRLESTAMTKISNPVISKPVPTAANIAAVKPIVVASPVVGTRVKLPVANQPAPTGNHSYTVTLQPEVGSVIKTIYY